MKLWPIEEVLGLVVIECEQHADERGWFQELYSTAHNYPHLIGRDRHLNLSSSKKNVVRGLHVTPFARLYTCVCGRAYEVVADLRQGSSTFRRWYALWVDVTSRKQMFVPAGCAHGFFSAEDDTLMLCLQDAASGIAIENRVHWRDPKIGIKWPQAEKYTLTESDRTAEFLRD